MHEGRHNLLRARGDDYEARVEPVELFFDLVFVFAITQLSHRLIEHPNARGAAETGVLFLAIWWTWINSAWATNWLDPKRTRVRLLLFALMGAGLVASTAIPQAFAERGLAFAGGFVAMEVGRSLFMLNALRGHDRGNFRNFLRILIWQLPCAALWIAGGLAGPDARLWFWAGALTLWSIGPLTYFRVPGLARSSPHDWSIDPHHLAERCSLFVILALGESILVLGATFAGLAWTAEGMAAAAAGLAGTIAMWWIYFNIGAERAQRVIEESAAPGRIGRDAYTYWHAPIGAGIVTSAAAVEWVLAHPTGHAEIYVVAAGLGGPALYLAGVAVFKRTTGAANLPFSHELGLGALAALALVARWTQPWQLAIAIASVMIGVAIWETRSLGARHRAAEASAARRETKP